MFFEICEHSLEMLLMTSRILGFYNFNGVTKELSEISWWHSRELRKVWWKQV